MAAGHLCWKRWKKIIKKTSFEMDYSEHYKIARMMALAQGVTPEQYDRAETWYYDETDNVKHLALLSNKRINADEKSCFVLGGVQAGDVISDAELRAFLGKEPGRELKSKTDLRGEFVDILRKDNFKRMLELIEAKSWHVHFMMVQVWYYAFVDIIDSINGDLTISFPLKAILYKILKKYPDETVSLLGKYHYPNIADKDKKLFLDGIINLAVKFLGSKPNINDERMTHILLDCLCHAKSLKELTFIQDETPDEWVKWFTHFYSTEIAAYPNKTLVLDIEKQVEKAIKEDPIEISGSALSNYKFEDSTTNPMIQVCDYVVCILRKYAIFLDRSMYEVLADIEQLDAIQLSNYKLFNRILKRSLEKNPLYFHYITSVEMQFNINQLMEKYGSC